MDLSAFAGVMPIDVLNRLLSSTGHWTNNLSLRGMDAFPGSALVAPARGRWSFLTNVDLRGCRSLDESHLVGMMENAPYLFKVCLKGVQATTPTVLAALAQHCRWVVRLNISRCWQLDMADVETFILSLSTFQASRFQSLRIAGLKAKYPDLSTVMRTIADRMVNLIRLDLNGCSWLCDTHLEQWAWRVDALPKKRTHLRYLILTDCSSLGPSTITHLTNRLPVIHCLELANIPNLLEGPGMDPWTIDNMLFRLFQSMPLLWRLDLDETGRWGGGIGDFILQAFQWQDPVLRPNILGLRSLHFG
jgi:F-box/leucine-rich repeat protein 2/20